VPTATKAVQLRAAHLIGATAAATPLHLTLALAPRDAAGAAKELKAISTPGSPSYEHFLTPAQYTARYAPTQMSANAVASYLRREGFRNVSVLPTRLLVTADGTARMAEKAFRTSISTFKVGSLTVHANTAAAFVPRALQGVVQSVIGLNDLPLPTPHPAAKARTQAAGSPDPFIELSPKLFQNTYDAKGTPTGAKTPIAIFTQGNVSRVIKDLRVAEAKNHLPVVSVTQINVGPQSNDTSGLDEFDMDTQVSTAMATTVKHLYLYNVASLIDSNIVAAFGTFAAQHKAVAMSASIGGCDLNPYLDGSMVATDVILQEAAMQGQTLFASSGDNGEGCAYLAATGVPSSFPGTNWPASGEYTTAVGGTSLLTDASGNRVQEIAWVGSGGGTSEVENPGWWQANSNPLQDAEFVTGGRAVPDISLDADPNFFTAAAVYVDGQVAGVGGTSLSSPLMLGAWARLQSAHGNRLGLASIALYRLYNKVNPGTDLQAASGGTVPVPETLPAPNPAPVKGFTDITVGSNGLWEATPGYDEVTGLGAPDLAALSKALR